MDSVRFLGVPAAGILICYGAPILRKATPKCRATPVAWVMFWAALWGGFALAMVLGDDIASRKLGALANILFLILMLSGRGFWRKLGQKLLASSGLTSINAASFRRQARESV